eukprot:252537_1
MNDQIEGAVVVDLVPVGGGGGGEVGLHVGGGAPLRFEKCPRFVNVEVALGEGDDLLEDSVGLLEKVLGLGDNTLNLVANLLNVLADLLNNTGDLGVG